MSTRIPGRTNDRKLIALLEDERARLRQELARAGSALREAQLEQARLSRRLEEASVQLGCLSGQFVAASQQAADLAGLYVAAVRLHEAEDAAGVLRAIHELTVELIGCEQFALLELDASGGLSRTHGAGLEQGRLLAVPAGEGVIGRVARTGDPFFAAEPLPSASRSEPEGGERELTACAALTTGGRVVGVLALFQLLPHSASLGPSKREMLGFLCQQGGLALARARSREARRT